MDKTFTGDDLNIFKHPARLIVAGTSNSGKTFLVNSLIKKYHKNFTHIFICGVTEHDLQNDNDIKNKLYLSKDIIDPIKELDDFEMKNANILFVVDDLQHQAVVSTIVADMYTKGRHNNISICMLQQNLFLKGKFARDISLNASHFILLRMRDITQIQFLARQVYGAGKISNAFVDLYKHSVLGRKFGYLLVDLALNTPNELQLRSNIVGESLCELVYQL